MKEDNEFPEGFFDAFRRMDTHILFLLMNETYHPLYKMQTCNICQGEYNERTI